MAPDLAASHSPFREPLYCHPRGFSQLGPAPEATLVARCKQATHCSPARPPAKRKQLLQLATLAALTARPASCCGAHCVRARLARIVAARSWRSFVARATAQLSQASLPAKRHFAIYWPARWAISIVCELMEEAEEEETR